MLIELFQWFLLPLALLVGGIVLRIRAQDRRMRNLALVPLVTGGIAVLLIVLTVVLAIAGLPFPDLRDPAATLALAGLGLFLFIFWAWMLADCGLNERTEDNERLVWTLIILFAFVVGAAIYYFGRLPRRRAEAER